MVHLLHLSRSNNATQSKGHLPCLNKTQQSNNCQVSRGFTAKPVLGSTSGLLS
ncbi:hypothetical protein JCGZ_12682 [Jatropha curcas]|uniref:Uncharacterized protein n=1 Tax=Jatropha curcas TaxID=180498 RepID=A0A067KR87_JATCU|nr:hypothetical protein JCGZ_12682 [Jatropha curcas]